jgi:CheY-like chemotaxis protein
MPPWVAERIFEPFFTTKKKGRGTGMGLAVVHGIVKSHKGDIQVKTCQGKGTVFDVFLPASSSPEAPEKRMAPAEPVRGGTERILFVDDESMLVDVAENRLTALGYQVTGETNSLRALERFCQTPDRFDLVITDMAMPGMTGMQMAREMMAIQPGIPVILCSGYHEHLSKSSVKKAGFKNYLIKPVVFHDLARAIYQALMPE